MKSETVPTKSTPQLPCVLVLIVNFRVGDLTIQCLNSLELELQALPGSLAVVVDNHSGDGSAEQIQRAVHENNWNDWVEFVESPENSGFAAGNNLALRHGRRRLGTVPDFVLLLNPDTIARPRAICELMSFIEGCPKAGIVGGRSEDPDGTPQHCCFRFPSLWNEFASNIQLGFVDRLLRKRIARVPISDDPHQIGWVSGAFMLVRGELIERVGLFDERFFLYYEETDLAMRAAQAGWTCWHVPSARVVHLVGFSSGVTRRDRRPARKPVYWFQSRRRYFVKHHGALYAALADLLAILGTSLRRIRMIIARRPNSDPPRFLSDLISNSVFLKAGSG